MRRKRARVVIVSSALAAAASASGACNAILGNEERFIDERSTLDSPPSTRDAATDTTTAAETGADVDVDTGDVTQGPITIPVPQDWRTPNGATFTTTDAGTTITGFTAAGHPVIVPKTPLAIPADDYTVDAVIRAPTNGEWGILTRVKADGAGALLGSKFGGEQRLFTGTMGPPAWSPTQQNLGPVYTYKANARYRMKLRAQGTQTFGKMWELPAAEPAAWQVLGTPTDGTSRGVGYYIYNTYDVVLESMQVTVP